jgi:hypothetical protein
MKTELIEKLKVIENFFTRTNDKESKEVINEAIALLEKPMHDYAGQSDAIEFLESIRAYEHEAGIQICYDERTSEELYQSFLNREEKQK